MLGQSSLSMSTSKIGDYTSNENSKNPNEFQQIFSYMKNVLSNPSMIEEMEKFMAAK